MRISNRSHRHVPTGRTGVAAAELAIILPALLLIVLTCVDLGRAAYTFIALKSAVRAGAGYGIMNPYSTSGAAAWTQAIQNTTKNEMQNQMNYNSSNVSFLDSTPSWATDTTGPDATVKYVTVTAQYPFVPLMATILGVSNPINLKATVKMPMIR